MAPVPARRPLWKPLATFWLILFVAACSSSTQTGGGASTAPARTNPLAGVTVPDAFTPLTVAPISRPTFPFPGSDGKYHLAFDVQITNATGGRPASLPSTWSTPMIPRRCSPRSPARSWSTPPVTMETATDYGSSPNSPPRLRHRTANVTDAVAGLHA